MKLNESELKQINGGASIWVIIGTVTALIFGVGALDGYTRPYKCRK